MRVYVVRNHKPIFTRRFLFLLILKVSIEAMRISEIKDIYLFNKNISEFLRLFFNAN